MADRWWLGLTVMLGALAGCATDEAAPTRPRPRGPAASAEPVRWSWPAPAADPSRLCADLGEVRVCWGAQEPADRCSGEICVGDRPLPGFAAPTRLGWRCSGIGPKRECFERNRGVTEFDCRGDRCVQRVPRLPDSGEWTCAAVAGATVCKGGEPAAGVAPMRSEQAAWICGRRRGPAAKATERICVDLSPDFPDGLARGWRCRYTEAPVERACERDAEAHVLGDTCSPAEPCVDGARCVAERCAPERPDPACFLDSDCTSGSCRVGSCFGGKP